MHKRSYIISFYQPDFYETSSKICFIFRHFESKTTLGVWMNMGLVDFCIDLKEKPGVAQLILPCWWVSLDNKFIQCTRSS